MKNKPVNILAIESSCDETAAAIVQDGHEVKASVVASSVDLHQKYGGVVPEIASRAHIESIYPVLQETLAQVPLAGEQHPIPYGNWDELGSELNRSLVMRQEIASGATRLCFDSPALTGTALLQDRRPLHLSFFPAVYAEDVISLD